MTRANTLGITGIVLLLLSMAPPYDSLKQPLNAALIITAFILGYKAAMASRWWSLLPGFIFFAIAYLLLIGFPVF